jgi:hypothetical protein
MRQSLLVVLARAGIVVMASTVAAHTAHAEAPTPRESVAGDTLEEIVVTAQRKDQKAIWRVGHLASTGGQIA